MDGTGRLASFCLKKHLLQVQGASCFFQGVFWWMTLSPDTKRTGWQPRARSFLTTPCFFSFDQPRWPTQPMVPKHYVRLPGESYVDYRDRVKFECATRTCPHPAVADTHTSKASCHSSMEGSCQLHPTLFFGGGGCLERGTQKLMMIDLFLVRFFAGHEPRRHADKDWKKIALYYLLMEDFLGVIKDLRESPILFVDFGVKHECSTFQRGLQPGDDSSRDRTVFPRSLEVTENLLKEVT